MNITTLAAKYPSLVFTVVIFLMATGVYSYFTLPAQEDPKITIREALVTTQFPGLDAQQMELLVTKKLEQAIRQISEIEEVRSTSRNGVSIIHAKTYDHLFALEQVWDDLREKVSDVYPQLPQGTLPPIVNDDFGDVAVMTFALVGDEYSMFEKQSYAQHIQDQLYTVDGVKTVDLHGQQNEQVTIAFSSLALSKLGMPQSYVLAQLSSQYMLMQGLPVDKQGAGFDIIVNNQFESIEDIRNQVIQLPNSPDTIALKNIARVTRQPASPPSRSAFFNGKQAIVFSITMQDGFRVLEFAPRVLNKLDSIEESLPIGISLPLITYQAEQVEKAVFGVTANVLQTLVIVLVVVILFLGMRVGLIVGTIVPSVMLVTLAIMGFFDIPLERMSLATMVIALGLLVDNGIVIAENFKRKLEEGVSKSDALELTGKELSLPLLSSTLTTILVFLPLMLAAHSAGEYTRSISLVVLISLLSSWFLAMMVTPILCQKFMKLPDASEGVEKSQGGVFLKIEEGYARALNIILNHKLVSGVVLITCFVLGVYGISNAPKEFFPSSDRTQILVTLDFPTQTTLTTTNSRIKDLNALFENDESLSFIQSGIAYTGFGGPRFVLSLAPLDPADNKAFMVLTVSEDTDMSEAINKIRDALKQKFPHLTARVTDMFLGPSDPSIIHAQVKGPDAQHVYQKGLELQNKIAALPGVIDVWQDWENPTPQISVNIDNVKALRAGVSADDTFSALSMFYRGNSLGNLIEGDDEIPVIAIGQLDERRSIDTLKRLNVNPQGEPQILLSQVASLQVNSQYGAIQREDFSRTVTVEARPTLQSAEDLAPQIVPILHEIEATLAEGHSVEFDGIITDSAKGKAALAANVPMAIGIVCLLLIAQFNGFIRPIIILMTIPLLTAGAALGLFVTQSSFGFMVILGLLSLAGIIINNAIVLLDRIDIDRQEQSELREAILLAGKRRLRPILMTTITTILGLLPLIISKDPLFFGMASVIAFGLLVGTLLTLGVTPLLYEALLKKKS